MSDNDLLTLALDRSDKAARKTPGVVDPVAHGQGDESGYDLTNPNLHHGADAKYGPTVQTSTQSRSIFHSDVGVVSGPTVNESFHLTVGGSGAPSAVIAELSGYEGQTFSSSVAGRTAGSATGDRLTSASLPAVHMDEFTGSISAARTGGDFGNEPIAVQTTEAHAHAVSANFDPAAGVSDLTAIPIADQSGYEGKAFSLNVAGHFIASAAGDSLTFSASLPVGLSINAHTGVISGIPTDSDFGNNTITVTATDAHGKAISESFHLAVGDSGPTATAIASQSAYEGKAFSLNVASHFTQPAAGDTLTYSASLPVGLSINAHTGVISGIPADSDFGENTITVTATDAHGKAISESFHLAVDDSGPTATAIASQSAYEGKAFSLNIASHFSAPAAGDVLTYSASLPAGLNINAHTGVISGTPTDSDFGNSTITVTATDAHGKAISETFHLTVGDSGPTATAIASQSGYEGQSFSLNAASHFIAPAAGDTLTFSASLPTGLSIDHNTGVISGTPTDSDFGNHTITVTATDAHGKAVSESFHLAVGDSGPAATAIADQSGYEGQALSLNVASHFTAPAAGDILTFSASLPAGLSINAHTGVISGTPTDSDFGNHAVTVTATDAHGKAISETFHLAVGDSGPTATVIADQSAYEGKAFSFSVANHFTAPAAGDALTYSALVPGGLSINAHTGVISGTPTDGDFGSNTITVTATDARGKTISETFHLVVGDSGPTATAIADQSGYEGKAFSINVASHFKAPAAGDALTYSASLPAGLSINAHTGVISGTPTDSDFGNNTITVTATDAHGKAVSETFHLTVGDSGPTATTIANQSAYEGKTFSLNVASHFKAPAAGDTLTFSASLPTGLSIDHNTGVISGTPTDSDFGNNTVTVTATDAHGKAVSESFHLAVGDSGPTATTIASQSGYEGQAFSLNVASHFTAPAAGDTLTFSALLPTGLSIDHNTGLISGIPTDSDFGNHTITVTATDAHGKAISESFHLAVGDSGPTATAIADQSSYEGQAFSLNVASHFSAPAAGDALTYSGSLPTGLSIDHNTGVISGTPTDSDFGNHTITVTATDAHGKAISETFHLAVADSGPTATTIPDQSANEGQAFSLNVASHFAVPAAGDTLTYSASLPAGLTIDPHTGVISGTPADSDYTSSAHAYNFNFTSFDGSFTVSGQLTTANSLDTAGGYDITGIAGSVVGPNGAAINNLISNPNPAAESISPDGVFIYDNVLLANSSPTLDYGGILFTSNNLEYNIFYQNGQYQLIETLAPHGTSWSEQDGTFTISAVPASDPITVTATDAHGQTVSESFNLTVGDSGPAAAAIPDQSAYEGHAFSLNASGYFTAPVAGDTLTYSASLPNGLTIDSHTGLIAGTPADSDLGNNPITITATDAHGQSVSEGLNLAVADHNDTFFIASHTGNITINGNPNWTDAVDLHNIGQNASFNLTDYAADGHVVQSWTGLVVDGAANSDHAITLAQGDHAVITVNHMDGSAADHITLQHIDHVKY
jgi:Putative Ig domain